MTERRPIIEAKNLTKIFRSNSLLRQSTETRALDDVSLSVYEGEVVALIGESGSGKTTLGKVITRLTTVDEGEVFLDGEDLFALDRATLRERRRSIQMVFQNQTANLHPKMTVHEMLDESLRLHRPGLDAEQRKSHADALLDRVGLSERADQRPTSMSGGERRRAGLARILATKPKLIVADEPTSGLDAAIKLQIIELLKELKGDALTYLLISHDLGLVRRIADRVVVMLKGRIVEEVAASELGKNRAHHPYTERLMRAVDLDRARKPASTRESTQSSPEPLDPRGCVFAGDCALAREKGIVSKCRSTRPPLVTVADGHRVACFGALAADEAAS